MIDIVKLGDVFAISSGGTPSKKESSFYEGGTIPWIKTGDLKNKYVSDDVEHITESGLKNSSAKLFPKNTVLLAMYGATIGACSILPYDASTNQACAAFLPIDTILPEYLFYFLSSKKNEFIRDGVGGAQPNISAGYLKKVEMPYITIEKQKIVIEVIKKVDDLILLRKQQLSKLDKLVKSRFIELFGEIGTDVNGWGLTCLRDCCVINPKKNEDKRLCEDLIVSFVPMTFVSETGEIDTSGTKSYNDVKTGFTYFAENDVLFAKITPCMENGKGAIVKGLFNKIGFGSTEFHVLRPINGVSNPYWIYAITAFNQFRIDETNNMTGSAGQRRVPASFLETYKVALPPIDLQTQFATFVEQTDKLKFEVKQSLEKLETLKKSLMQRYFG